MNTTNQHMIVTAGEIDALTGSHSSKNTCAFVLTTTRPAGQDVAQIAGVPDKGSLTLWAGSEIVGCVSDSEVPGLRRGLKRGLVIDHWIISIKDPDQFKEFCTEAFRVLVGDFPDTDLSQWSDREDRQRKLSEEALNHALAQGQIVEAYFLIDGPVGDKISSNKEGPVKGPWGVIDLQKRPVIVTDPGLL